MKPLINQFILNDQYRELWKIRELRRQFAKEQYAYLPQLFTPTAFSILKEELDRLEQFTVQRNYRSIGPDTPRYMSTLGGAKVFDQSPILAALYVHYEFRTLLSEIVDGPVYHNPDEREVVGLNYLLDVGNTHGWHLDDDAFAVIIMGHVPSQGNGGTVEVIPDWNLQAQKLGYQENEPLEDYVNKCRSLNLVREYYHTSGDAYLLRGDEALHRVTPLKTAHEKRAIIGFGYAHTPNPVYTDRVTGLYDEVEETEF